MIGSIRWFLVLFSFGVLLASPTLVFATNLLTNGNFNSFSNIPGRSWRGVDEKVGTGWAHFYVASGTQLDKLHWLSSTDYAAYFNPDGEPYELEGENGSAQNMWSAYAFDAGIYQRVTGLTPGTVYAFDVPLTTFWRGPGYDDSDGIMKKWVGIDPTGGIDPTSPNVIWSDVDSDDKKWVYMDLAARAESDTMTFFVRIQAPENSSYNHTDLDIVYIDAAKVDLAPTVSLSVAAIDTEVSITWVGSAASDWSLKGVELQYRDKADGEWQAIQGKTGSGDSNFSFTGQPGHTYTVRVRPWQNRSEPYNNDVDMPGLWVEKSVTVGGAFAGHVRNNYGLGIGGALVSTAENDSNSGSQGFYALQPPKYGQSYALTAGANGYLSPLPILGTVADSASVTPIDFTLKPVNDAITNGDFESDAGDWSQMGAGSAMVFSGNHRSGDASLELTGPISISQVVFISDAYNPTLSFWYKSTLDGNDSFVVSLEGSTASVSKTFAASNGGEWQHAFLPLRYPYLFTGSLTASFHVTGGQVLLDEVSLGEGPHSVFLPTIFRSRVP